MVQRQPEDGVAFRRRLKRLLNQRRVVEQMVVTEHHSFRQGCRSGRVLQEGDLPPLDLQVVPGLLALGPSRSTAIQGRSESPDCGAYVRLACSWCSAVLRTSDGLDAPSIASTDAVKRLRLGIGRRNGNNSRIQASEESGDEIQPRREQQECSLAEGSQGLQLTRDRHRALVQGLVSQARFLLAVAAQKLKACFSPIAEAR